MLDRQSELEAFKKLDLGVIASSYGYEINRRKSTPHSVLMVTGNDKIIISQNGKHYVYCSVYDPGSAGTVIDFAQKVVEPGCSLGRVRQLLRPFLNTGYMANVRQTHAGKYAPNIKPSELDLVGVAARYAAFVPIAEPHHYLCETRGIPFDLLMKDRLRDCICHCPRRGSVIFPHWGEPTGVGTGERCLVGYEIKGPNVNLFSKGGRKGLWMSAGKPNDTTLAFVESGLDAVSYLVARGEDRTRVASLSGRMNPQQPALVRSAIERMEEGAQIVAAFDNDEAGDELTQSLKEIVSSIGRSDLAFKEDRPPTRGADWNQVVMEKAFRPPTVPSLALEFGR